MKKIEFFLKSLLKEKSHVIWDWNGTLVNDLEIAVRSINSLLIEHGLPVITQNEYKNKFGFPIRDFYLRIGFDFRQHDWEMISRTFSERFYSALTDGSLHDGARELLEAIKREYKTQSILSATQEPELHRLLSAFGLHHLFDHAYGLDHHYADSKLDRGRELIVASGIAPQHTILIGDTDHDLAVGRELGVDVILLAHGHQTFEHLAGLHDAVIEL